MRPSPACKKTMRFLLISLPVLYMLAQISCAPTEPNELDGLGTVPLRIKDAQFEAWVADSIEERNCGLMFVTQEQMADLPDGRHRGMIFVFPREEYLSFWMKDTIIPLDIAFIRTDGTIINIHTMPPLVTGHFPSSKPARYALEVRAGLFSELGITAGDVVEIPQSVLKQH